MTVLERLTAKCGQTATGCWEWHGKRDVDGYGRFSIRQRWYLAHRIAYELLVGPIAARLQLDHLCRNRACVNPAHLEPVTARENVRRASQDKACCKNGHPFDEANTYSHWRHGMLRRHCRACNRAASARLKAKRGSR